MNAKGYKKRLDFQQKTISRQSQQIEDLNAEIVKLRLQIEEKDNVINSVSSLKEELKQNVAESKNYADRSKKLVRELKQMKKIMNKEVYKNRWWLIKLLLK